ncbi:MAG: hypothetical protein IJX49_04615 [Clostridia bacterium]|nr:hypothetical protein [Clostridia bacterium]
MRYNKQTVKYVSKNFIFLLPFAILPALLFSFSTDEEAIIRVVKAIFTWNLSSWSFFDLFRAISVLNFGSWQSLVFGVIGILFMVPCVAMMMAWLEKHFRIGKRTFNGLWGKLNDNFISTCGYAFLLLVIYEVWALLTSALLFFVSRIAITALAYSLSGGVFVVMHVVLLYAIGCIYLWLPCMQITGFRAMEALHYSYQLYSPVKGKVLLAQFLLLLFSEALIAACAYWIQNAFVFILLTTVLYLIIIIMYCVRMQIVYFDRDQIERADLVRYYHR